MRFYITGLPRSRTAWLANLMTNKDSFCFHEPVKYVQQSTQEIEEYLDEKTMDYRYTGVCDSSIPFYNDNSFINPDEPLLVVVRPIEEVIESMKKLNGQSLSHNIQLANKASDNLEKFTEYHTNKMYVNSEDLDNPSTVESVMRFLTPDADIDTDRINELVNVKVEYLYEKLEQMHMNLDKALKL